MLRTNSIRKRTAQALVEYALLIAGVALSSVVAIAVFGNKTSDVVAVMAGLLPGANPQDNAPINNGGVFATQIHHGNIELDPTNMAAPGGVNRWGNVFGHAGASQFVAGGGSGHD